MTIPVLVHAVFDTPQNLLKGATAGFFGLHGLKFDTPNETWADLLPRIIRLERRIKTLDMGTKVIDGSSLLALSVLVLI